MLGIHPRLRFPLVAALAFVTATCATAPPAPVTLPDVATHFVRPDLGHPVSPLAQNLNRAWEAFRAGNFADAGKRFADITRRDPGYAPAQLGSAAVALTRGDAATAEALISRVRSGATKFAAAEIYAAEYWASIKDLARAVATYQAILGAPGVTLPPSVNARFEALRTQYFDSLFASASQAVEPQIAIDSLRRALQIRPDASAARILLVQKLIGTARFEEARVENEPLYGACLTDRADVPAALAEIDAGRGRYQEAIVRLERLARRNPEQPEYARRLDEIKRRWNEANLPPRFQQAAASDALTRAELAVLIYWKVAAVRFARDIAEPPIAVDIADVSGRDELIRAAALSFFNVDPVTREIDPGRVVTRAAFIRIATRILTMRGVPSCAAGIAADHPQRLEAMLAACGVNVEDLSADQPISGATASKFLDRLDAILSSSE
ncbi:MAG: tetratricopeptide repeat protein [Thermoanaerobaculia bacterium]